jgi:hypothetical protein
MLGAELRRGHAEPPGRRRAKTLDDDVRPGHQPIERSGIPRRPQIERDALLAAIEQKVVDAAPVEQRRKVAQRIAAPGIFDLDHLGAHLRQHQRRKCAGDQTRQIQYANTCERQ